MQMAMASTMFLSYRGDLPRRLRKRFRDMDFTWNQWSDRRYIHISPRFGFGEAPLLVLIVQVSLPKGFEIGQIVIGLVIAMPRSGCFPHYLLPECSGNARRTKQ